MPFKDEWWWVQYNTTRALGVREYKLMQRMVVIRLARYRGMPPSRTMCVDRENVYAAVVD